ncbi:MAG TPA: MerR family transcriptional regulator [Streptosporangiaceae bacterium]|nr:MerR family transcriptional regulator [Streptosporangiaceae bacterium]
MQIGEVAERTALSLRAIRYYGEVGLVTPSARSQGGFRLYTEADVERLLLVKRMKPLELSLEEMADLLSILDQIDKARPAEQAGLRERLSMYEHAAQARCAALREQLASAQDFAARLRHARDAARKKESNQR